MLPEEFFVESNAENISVYTANNIGDVCQTDRHCSKLSNTRCQGGKCTCKNGTYEDFDSCLIPRMFMIELDYEATVLAFERSLKNCTSDSDCGNEPKLHLLPSSDGADKYTTEGMSGNRLISFDNDDLTRSTLQVGSQIVGLIAIVAT
ncbi:hypothetical protein KQX54_016363 [Cotesia glomerata]|uniref:EB domain-containing protein n=1 Tax=Cotesia glomerata TaxID=32391 RepID=A0AAV7J102_COTGL|nr:hypothetical protein KQX54_016363 [Cotesia glomerata]